MNRVDGWYWVKCNGEWEIARYWIKNYGEGSWIRKEREYSDDDFDEIDERRITREPEKQKIKPVRLYYTDPPEVTDCPDGYCNYIGKCKNDGDCLRYKQQKDSGLGNKLFGLI